MLDVLNISGEYQPNEASHAEGPYVGGSKRANEEIR